MKKRNYLRYCNATHVGVSWSPADGSRLHFKNALKSVLFPCYCQTASTSALAISGMASKCQCLHVIETNEYIFGEIFILTALFLPLSTEEVNSIFRKSFLKLKDCYWMNSNMFQIKAEHSVKAYLSTLLNGDCTQGDRDVSQNCWIQNPQKAKKSELAACSLFKYPCTMLWFV